MKLRIHKDSIRLRLTRSEVAAFDKTGYISDSLDFGSMGNLNFRVTAVDDFAFRCRYDSSGIEIRVPREVAKNWTSTDRVDMTSEQSLDNGKSLHIVVEKDFQCIHKDTEFNADAYPNPLASHAD